jgi:hypothetical protein
MRSVFDTIEDAVVAVNAATRRYAELAEATDEPSLSDMGLLSIFATSVRIQVDGIMRGAEALEALAREAALGWEGREVA